ncbi:MAG: hypothetical protein MUC42_15270 [Bryobacter sp.]|nr:hypothetical protein [Bryobacter sp.]
MRRFLLWDFARGSWQYDVIVALILAFIFLTPRTLFRDQPRPSNVALLPAEAGTSVYWVETELLPEPGSPALLPQAEKILQNRFKHQKIQVVRVEPIFDAEKEIKGYMAYAKP